jgi:hypothetical protein
MLPADAGIAREPDVIAELDRALLDAHAAQHRQGARLDRPLRDAAVGIARPHAERGMRIAPQHLGHLARKLGHGLRIEPAEETVVRVCGARSEHAERCDRR